MRKKWLNQWFTFDFNGTIRRAKCIDIEFETGIRKPLLLFQTKFGNKFWLTRGEVEDHEVQTAN